MNSFLFVWNPAKWQWTHLEENIDQLHKTGSVTEEWSCSSHKKAKPGDRAFLMKVGKQVPNGIIGSATIICNPYFSEFRRGETKPVPRMRVKLEFDILLNSDREPILNHDILNKVNF